MKIAIPCENGEVMQHFGHATEFTVYTIEDIKPIEKETVTFDDTNHEKVAGGLKSRGVDLVICGNIGEGAHAAIDNAHMLLISGVTGNADEAVDSFLQGNLELMTGDSSASAGGCGAGVAAFAASRNNIEFLTRQMNVQTLGYDKLNQLRHVKYFKNAEGLYEHMKKQADYLRPKFDCTLAMLEDGLGGLGIAEWTRPNGGYFVSFVLCPS